MSGPSAVPFADSVVAAPAIDNTPIKRWHFSSTAPKPVYPVAPSAKAGVIKPLAEGETPSVPL